MHRYIFVLVNSDLFRRLELLSLDFEGITIGKQVQVFDLFPYRFQTWENLLAGALNYEVAGA